MLLLKFEDNVSASNLVNLKDFKKEDILIPEEFYIENILIKGSARTGKTDKILLNMFFNVPKGENVRKIYFTTSYNYQDIISNKIVLHSLNKEITEEKLNNIISDINDDKDVVVYLKTPDINREKNVIKLESLLFKLSEKYKMFFFFDEFQYLNKLNFITKKISENKDKFYLSVQYSNQLKYAGYTDEEIFFIKEHSKSVDTEKQNV